MVRSRIWKLGAALPALFLACSGGDPADPMAEDQPPTAASPAADTAHAGGSIPADTAVPAPSETATPSNRPPELMSLEIEPREHARADRDIVAVPHAEDPDGDAVTFEYRWSVNGRLVSDADAVLSHAHFERGDEVQLSLRASDGVDSSEWRREDRFPIGNSEPRITSIPGDLDSDGTFRYPIVVEDSDGDRAYRYEMRRGPSGMRIDSVTGTVLWSPKPDQSGVHPVTIAVNDRHGGVTVQDFDVRVAFEDVPPAAPQP